MGFEYLVVFFFCVRGTGRSYQVPGILLTVPGLYLVNRTRYIRSLRLNLCIILVVPAPWYLTPEGIPGISRLGLFTRTRTRRGIDSRRMSRLGLFTRTRTRRGIDSRRQDALLVELSSRDMYLVLPGYTISTGIWCLFSLSVRT